MQILYAIALVPVGFLADKADRPRLLAAGLAAWSVLTVVASKVSLPISPAVKEGPGRQNARLRCSSKVYIEGSLELETVVI